MPQAAEYIEPPAAPPPAPGAQLFAQNPLGLPGAPQLSSPTFGLASGAPAAMGPITIGGQPGAAAPVPTNPTSYRQQAENFWSKIGGVNPSVAQGIADAIGGESGFRPSIMGDSGTSGGLYQEHADRFARLKEMARRQGLPWSDPMVQHVNALAEVTGGDPTATKHWEEIKNQPDTPQGRANAKALWSQYFERPAGTNLGAAATDAANRVREGYGRLAGDYRSQAEAALKEAYEMKGSIGDQMKLVRDALEKSDKAQEAALKFVQKPPAQPEIDGMKHMAGLATVVGIFGGLLTRAPLRASLNAGAAAIEAYNDRDRERYKESYDQWKNQTEMMFKIADMSASRLKNVLYAENLGFNEKRAMLDTILRAQGQSALADQAAISGDQWVAEFIQKNDAAQEAKKLRMAQMEFAHELAKLKLDNNPEGQMFDQLKAQHPEWDIEQQMAAWQKMKAGEKGAASGAGRERDLAAIVEADVNKFKADNPGATDDQIKAARYQSRLQHEKEMGAATKQPRSGSAINLQKFIEDFPETHGGAQAKSKDIQDFIAATAERTAEGRTVGTRSASLEMASNAAEAIIPLLEAESNKIDRTEYPDVNSVILSYEQRTGDPEVVRFGELINSMRYLYARALSPTGQARVADLQHFDEIMNKNWTKGQISAGLDQIKQSLAAERGAIAKTRSEVRGGGVPETTGAQPAAAAPPAIPANLQGKKLRGWSPSTKRFYDEDGKSYDATGKEMP